MRSILLFLSLIVITVSCTPSPSSVSYYGQLQNVEIERIIDIRTHVAEVKIDMKIKNIGSKTIDYYLLAIPQNKVNRNKEK
jgi:hypothetical protein